VLGCELWTENFDSMLALVKDYIIDLFGVHNQFREVRKVKLQPVHVYGEPCSTQPQSHLRLGIRRMALWLVGRKEVSLVSSVTQRE